MRAVGLAHQLHPTMAFPILNGLQTHQSHYQATELYRPKLSRSFHTESKIIPSLPTANSRYDALLCEMLIG
jgi:hypothetical protein